MTANGISSGSDLLTKYKKFQPTAAKKFEWFGTNGSAGASIMMQDPLSESYEGYSMVWRQLIWFHDCQWHHFRRFRFADTVQLLAKFCNFGLWNVPKLLEFGPELEPYLICKSQDLCTRDNISTTTIRRTNTIAIQIVS
jgi:hypothetical protein